MNKETPTNTRTLLCEVVPGQSSRVKIPEVIPPRFAIVEFQVLPNGDLRPARVHWNQWVKLTDSAIEKMGVNISRRTVLRLGHNGYVRLRRISPLTSEVCLRSLLRHLERVEADPQFWSRHQIPKGWDDQGEVIWEDWIMSRLEAFNATQVDGWRDSEFS